MKTNVFNCYQLDNFTYAFYNKDKKYNEKDKAMKREESFLGIDAKKERYMANLFSLLHDRSSMITLQKGTHFNHTELRLIGEVVAAKYEKKRLISAQLAKTLGVTRSAISQIVNRLEEEGVLVRVADDTDKKIAYIELTDGIMDMYKEDLQTAVQCIGDVVEEFGEEKFDTLCAYFKE
ncbi:MAG: MarR family transcriptional regulator, partial [Clostridia bacterium]|nr:MarR family transcriptional regulator [Clostridia bacterium]